MSRKRRSSFEEDDEAFAGPSKSFDRRRPTVEEDDELFSVNTRVGDTAVDDAAADYDEAFDEQDRNDSGRDYNSSRHTNHDRRYDDDRCYDDGHGYVPSQHADDRYGNRAGEGGRMDFQTGDQGDHNPDAEYSDEEADFNKDDVYRPEYATQGWRESNPEFFPDEGDSREMAFDLQNTRAGIYSSNQEFSRGSRERIRTSSDNAIAARNRVRNDVDGTDWAYPEGHGLRKF